MPTMLLKKLSEWDGGQPCLPATTDQRQPCGPQWWLRCRLAVTISGFSLPLGKSATFFWTLAEHVTADGLDYVTSAIQRRVMTFEKYTPWLLMCLFFISPSGAWERQGRGESYNQKVCEADTLFVYQRHVLKTVVSFFSDSQPMVSQLPVSDLSSSGEMRLG